MSNNKQSSVEWLYDKMYEHRGNITIEEYEQAKAMHKEEMDKVAGDFWNEGASYMSDGKRKYNSFDDYYNETFGGEQ